MKKFILIVILMLSAIFSGDTTLAGTPVKPKPIYSVMGIQSDWILVKPWALTAQQCNGCVSIWYTVWRSRFQYNGQYTYVVYFRSASRWSNGASARTEYSSVNFYYGNSIFHTSGWGIIGCNESTQQMFTFHMRDATAVKVTFIFNNAKLN